MPPELHLLDLLDYCPDHINLHAVLTVVSVLLTSAIQILPTFPCSFQMRPQQNQTAHVLIWQISMNNSYTHSPFCGSFILANYRSLLSFLDLFLKKLQQVFFLPLN